MINQTVEYHDPNDFANIKTGVVLDKVLMPYIVSTETSYPNAGYVAKFPVAASAYVIECVDGTIEMAWPEKIIKVLR